VTDGAHVQRLRVVGAGIRQLVERSERIVEPALDDLRLDALEITVRFTHLHVRTSDVRPPTAECA
jgi:hypothetical protein